MLSKLSRRTLFFLKIIISLVSLALVLSSLDWKSVASLLINMQLGWAFLGLVAFWLGQVAASMRLVYISRALGGSVDIEISLKAHLIGLWFNQVLPSSVGGDVIKIAILKKYLGLGVALRSGILDRFFGLFFIMATVVLTLPYYADLFAHLPGNYFWGIGILSIGFVSATLICTYVATHIQRRWVLPPIIDQLFVLLNDISRFRKKEFFWQQFWTSAIVHCSGFIIYAFLGLALNVHINFLDLVLLVPLISIIALFPLSLAGWGVRELGAVWLFGLVHVLKENALAMSIAYGLVLVVAGLPGLIVFLRDKKSDHQKLLGT